MFSIFLTSALSYLDCKGTMSINHNGTVNVLLGKNKWHYYYYFFNKNETESLRFSLVSTGPAQVYMQGIGMCPYFDDPMIIESPGHVGNKSVISPYIPTGNSCTIGIYSSSDDNNITVNIGSIPPEPEWKKKLPTYLKYGGIVIVGIFALSIIIYGIVYYKKTHHVVHKHEKFTNQKRSRKTKAKRN